MDDKVRNEIIHLAREIDGILEKGGFGAMRNELKRIFGDERSNEKKWFKAICSVLDEYFYMHDEMHPGNGKGLRGELFFRLFQVFNENFSLVLLSMLKEIKLHSQFFDKVQKL